MIFFLLNVAASSDRRSPCDEPATRNHGVGPERMQQTKGAIPLELETDDGSAMDTERTSFEALVFFSCAPRNWSARLRKSCLAFHNTRRLGGAVTSFLCSCRSSEDSAVVGEEEEAHRRWEAKLVQAVDKSKASRQRLVEQQGLEEVPEQPETDSPFVAENIDRISDTTLLGYA